MTLQSFCKIQLSMINASVWTAVLPGTKYVYVDKDFVWIKSCYTCKLDNFLNSSESAESVVYPAFLFGSFNLTRSVYARQNDCGENLI
jgi:hypothetical protein